jgi:hypothetical protein
MSVVIRIGEDNFARLEARYGKQPRPNGENLLRKLLDENDDKENDDDISCEDKDATLGDGRTS